MDEPLRRKVLLVGPRCFIKTSLSLTHLIEK